MDQTLRARVKWRSDALMGLNPTAAQAQHGELLLLLLWGRARLLLRRVGCSGHQVLREHLQLLVGRRQLPGLRHVLQQQAVEGGVVVTVVVVVGGWAGDQLGGRGPAATASTGSAAARSSGRRHSCSGHGEAGLVLLLQGLVDEGMRLLLLLLLGRVGGGAGRHAAASGLHHVGQKALHGEA